MSWRWDGGLVAFRDSYSVVGCASVAKTREDFGSGGGSTTCEVAIDPLDCDAIGAVQAALAHPDVAAARAAAPVLYGVDFRPVDGQVYRIDIAGDVIELGSECSDREGCDPIPEGLATLRETLMALAAVVDAAPECTAP